MRVSNVPRIIISGSGSGGFFSIVRKKCKISQSRTFKLGQDNKKLGWSDFLKYTLVT